MSAFTSESDGEHVRPAEAVLTHWLVRHTELDVNLPVGVVVLLATAAGLLLDALDGQSAAVALACAAAAVLGAAFVALVVRVRIGSDGIGLRRLVGREEFIPFHAIESAEVDGDDITIQLASHRRLALHRSMLVDRNVDPGRIVERINRGRSDGSPTVDSPASAAFLACGDRTARRWRSDLAHASAGHAWFRQPALPEEVLWRVVEDRAAPPDIRAAAAVALQHSDEANGRARLRVVANSCANGSLSTVLDTVASDADDDEVSDALGAFARATS